ncbi:MAG: hypothetical protein HYU66_01790 [Armatimonadetes bacterium]|nr:hypothetical protein [Armatimonadota bacterium]
MKWTRQYYNSSTHQPTATLETAADRKTLRVEFPDDGLRCTQIITSGPGEKLTLDYRYRQTRWDDGALQLGFAKPTEGFWAGADFQTEGRGGQLRAVVPVTFDPARRNPFVNATAISLQSIFGNLRISADKGLTLYDYEQRGGAFFLGFDERLPVGEEHTFHFELTFSPPRVEAGGLVLGGLALPDSIEDGLLRAGIRLSRAADGPREVTVRVSATRAGAAAVVAEAKAAPAAEPRVTGLELPLPVPGDYRLRIALTAAGKEVWQRDSLALKVLAPFQVTPDRSLYTREAGASLLALVRPGVRAEGLRLTVSGGGLSFEGVPVPGRRTPLPFDPGKLPDGATELTARLFLGQRLVAEAATTVRKAPPAEHEVKIDLASRGLLVDGIPTFPFGAYCFHPPQAVALEEATMSFTHLAPYRSTNFNQAGAQEEMLAALDRCAALGFRVHYDIRPIATMPDTPAKWDLLKREVEAVRSHPALLCWYLADEPELQRGSQPPELMAKAYRFVKELDPYHPCTMVFADPRQAPDYAPGMDIVMTDPYPIPNGPVTNVAGAITGLDDSLGHLPPVWVVPQAFGGGEWWAREPSAQEERAMTWLGIVHGATGVQYFMRVLDGVRPFCTRMWSACRDMADEVAELTPDLLSPLPAPEVHASDTRIHARGWATADALTVAAVNAANEPAPLHLTIAGAPDTTATVQFENRTIAVKGGAIDDYIDGFGTRVYRIPLRPEDPNAGVDPKNLTKNPGCEQQFNVGKPDGYYANAGKDGASIHVDSRVAYQGRHSVRFVTPADGGGMGLSAFPIHFQAGQKLRVSLWAKSDRAGGKLALSVPGMEQPDRRFDVGTGWTECVVTGTVAKDQPHAYVSYRPATAGVMWVDLFQVVPVP